MSFEVQRKQYIIKFELKNIMHYTFMQTLTVLAFIILICYIRHF